MSELWLQFFPKERVLIGATANTFYAKTGTNPIWSHGLAAVHGKFTSELKPANGASSRISHSKTSKPDISFFLVSQ